MSPRKLPVFLLLGFFALAAPTPGAVGSCGTDDLDQAADFMSYCQKREELISAGEVRTRFKESG